MADRPTGHAPPRRPGGLGAACRDEFFAGGTLDQGVDGRGFSYMGGTKNMGKPSENPLGYGKKNRQTLGYIDRKP